MTYNVFQKCKIAWNNDKLSIQYIILYKNKNEAVRTSFYHILNDIPIMWDNEYIVIKYRIYPNIVKEAKLYYKDIKYIKMYSNTDLFYSHTRSKRY